MSTFSDFVSAYVQETCEDMRREERRWLIEEGRGMALPTDDKARKALPIWDGVVLYFPDALRAVAEVSVAGNAQHNAGQKLHWAREKSTDQMNTAFRHMLDHGTGTVKDTDGTYHLAKAIWRLCAELQLTIERGNPVAIAPGDVVYYGGQK